MPAPQPPPATIRDVLDELDRIVDTTIRDNSPLGVFAWIYRRTTAKIAEGIREGRFENPARMESFDVDFARRYIDAYWRYRDEVRNGDGDGEGAQVTGSWRVAFGAAADGRATLLQHLLLGMNAHINLDLGIAAAGIAPGGQIDALEADFMLVNDLLAELTDEMQERIGRASPLMFLLDWVGGRDDEAVVNWSIGKARRFAWRFARKLAAAGDPDERDALIARTDAQVAAIGTLVARPPGFLLPKALAFIRRFEEKDTAAVIERIRD